MMKDMYKYLEVDYNNPRERATFEDSVNYMVKNFPGAYTKDENT